MNSSLILSTYINKLKRWLIEPVGEIHEKDRQKQAGLLAFLLLIIIALQLSTIQVITLNYTIGIILNLTAYLLSRTKYYRTGALLWGLTNSSITFAGYLTDNQMAMEQSGLFFLVFSLLLPALISGPRTIIAIGGFNLSGIFLLLNFNIPSIPSISDLGMAILFNLAATILVIGIVYYHNYLEKIRESVLRGSEEKLSATLNSISDAVIATNIEGKIVFMNPVAEQLTGWQTEEAKGVVISSVFNIIHEKTGNEKENPVVKVLREGTTVGLTNHTVLIAKDGRRTLIDDSAAPIRHVNGNITGVVLVFRNVTERKRAEEKIAYQAHLLQNVTDAIFSTDLAFNITSWNTAAEKIYGIKEDQVIGKPIADIIMVEYLHQTREEVARQLREEGFWEGEAIHKRKNGTSLYVFASATMLKDSTGNVTGAVGIVHDITKYKQAEEEILNSAERFNDFMKNSVEAFSLYDSDLNIIDMNETNRRMFFPGIKKEDIVGKGKNILDFDPSIKESGVWDKYKKVIKTGEPYVNLNFIPHPKWGDLHLTVKAFRMGKGLGININNITELKQAEKILHSMSEFNERIINESPIGIAIYDHSGHCITANESIAKIVGATREHVLAQNYNNIGSWKKSGLLELANNCILLNEKGRLEFEVESSFGKYASFDGMLVPFKLHSRQHLLLMLDDITKRKSIEQALRKNEASLAEAQRLANVGSWEWNLQTNDIEFSDEIYRILGMIPQEIKLSFDIFMTFVHPEDITTIQKYIEDIKNGQDAGSYEYRICRKNGDVRYIRSLGKVTYNEKNIREKMTGVLQDITKPKLAEMQIKTTLQEKEVLLKEIHHRVKNNLQVIASLLYLQSKNITDKKSLELFSDSRNRIKSMALVHETLYQSGNLSLFNFDLYIRNLVSHLFRSYKGNTGEITSKVDVDNVSLSVDAAAPCGLIINELVSNALKYAFPDRKGEIRIELHKAENSHFVLVVSDNGIGIPKNIDFQNSESLGLQLVNMLVSQLDGTIELYRDSGTMFQIIFTEPKYIKRIKN